MLVFLAKEWFQRVWGLGCVINAVHVLLSLVAWRGVLVEMLVTFLLGDR